MSLKNVLYCLGSLAALCASLPAQLDPEKALESLQPADGLEVSLFAAEPMLLNPTSIEVDPRGRVWVCEGVNYRGKANPPHRKTGDRVVVLEDRDGDGRADESRAFFEGTELEAPLGICYLGDRILVSQSPRIISIEVRPDGTAGEKKVFLEGFGGRNHDHGVHSVLLGFDGLLYGAFGNEGARVTDPSGKKLLTDGKPYFGGCVFRTQLDGTQSEVLAHNFRNNYECALDSFGNIWQSDNDDDGNQWVRFTYVMLGGNYGYLGPTGRHWTEEKKSHFHMEDPGVVPSLLRTGAGSPTGLCVYEGTLLPERFRGLPIHTDAGPRVVQCFRVKPLGAGWHVEGAPLDEKGRQTTETLSKIVRPETLLTSKDSFFRPSDVAVAPDGSLFVSDWYDPGVGGHGMGDTTRGRIYRITPRGHKGYQVPALDLKSETGLVQAFLSPALSTRSLATLELLGRGEAALGLLQGLAARRDEPLARARSLWILGRLAGGRPEIEKALADSDPRFRVLALRVLKATAPSDFLTRSRALLSDTDPQVRRELLVLLRDVAGEEALEAVTALAAQYDGQDRWYLEAIAIAARGREGPLFQKLAALWKGKVSPAASGIIWVLHPREAAEFLAERLKTATEANEETFSTLRSLSQLEGNVGAESLAALLASGSNAAVKAEAARLLEVDLGGKLSRWAKSPTLREGALKLLSDPSLAECGARLAGAGRIAELREPLESLARRGDASPESRLAAIRALGALADRASTATLRALTVETSVVSTEAAQALGRLGGIEPQTALRELLAAPGTPAETRAAVVKALGASKSGALILLQAARKGDLPEGVRSLATTVVHSSAFEDVRLMADKVLPRPKTGAGKELPPMSELVQRTGDAGRGKRVFFEESKGNCARCHRIERRGSDVGPDLSAIGTKYGREGLLESIVSPSAAISHEYKVWVLETSSAGLVTGYIVEETPEKVTLRDANGQKLSFTPDDVRQRAPSDVSLMPEGLVGSMTVEDLVDLLEFLGQQKAPAK